ncbi:hypothetical protein SEPCBS119000_000107 [Sporothrix epigloea]|uniref:Tachykinin family protein n=1 Tax=Sporothrix epigloea TaxID=1892477 RepID=A0ABP0D389_9PEZI
MDHFNATLQEDGALVLTRRGLRVAKHKYHGISFVNTSGPAQSLAGTVGNSGRKGKQRKATEPSSSFTSPSEETPTPASMGFSVFSAFSPAAAPEPVNKGSPGTTTSSQKAPINNKVGLSPKKPLVHRWKLATTPAIQKPKRKSLAPPASSPSAVTGSQNDRPRLAAGCGSDAAFNQSYAVSPGTAVSGDTVITPAESVASFASPLASPFYTSSRDTDTGLDSLSSLPVSTSALNDPVFAPQEWTMEYNLQAALMAPTISETRHHNQTAATAAKDRLASKATSYPSRQSRARKARINALVSSCQQVARSLPTWTMCSVPQLNKFEQRLFHQFFQLIPRKLYPFEDLLQYNPARSSEFYWMVVQDRAAVRCVLMCGAMFRAILGGTDTSEDLPMEVANVCRIVNQQLALHEEEQTQAEHEGSDSVSSAGSRAMQLTASHNVSPLSPSTSPVGSPQSTGSSGLRQRRLAIPEMTLECITTLALMGGSTGRYDHWHLHMQALRKMVDLNGGRCFLDSVRPSLLFKMRKTDLKGAMALAIRPYLPFDSRLFRNVSDSVLLNITRQDVLVAADALFADAACGLAPAVAATLGCLCVFVQAVQLAADLAKTTVPLPLDPYCFSEELYWLQYNLVSRPGPLRQDVSAPDAAAVRDAETSALRHSQALQVQPLQASRPNVLLPVDSSRLQTESYIGNHRAPLAALYLVPAAPISPSTLLEPAIRICSILYLKEFVPDFPRNLGGYAILLHILRSHLEDGTGDGVFAATHFALLTNPHARALLLWICLVGDTVSRLADANEERSSLCERYDRRVFRDRLIDLVRTSEQAKEEMASDTADPNKETGMECMDGVDGMGGMFAVDRLLDSDWALCHLLSLGRIRQLGEWSDRQAVVNILLEGASL